MRIFSKSRRKLSLKSRKYFAYAVGEVTLIVIGILIATTINSYKERQKSGKQLDRILLQVKENLITDTLEITEIAEHFEKLKPQYDSIIEGLHTPETALTCKGCKNLLTNFIPFKAEDDGYELLKGFISPDLKRDSLNTQILRFYSAFDKLIGINQKRIEDDVFEAIIFQRENYDWFAKQITGMYISPEYVRFVAESQEYRNRVAFQYLMIYQNNLPVLNAFKLNARILVREIDKKLKAKE